MAKVTVTIEDKVQGDQVLMLYADHEGWEEGETPTNAVLMGAALLRMIDELCRGDEKEVTKVGGTD